VGVFGGWFEMRLNYLGIWGWFSWGFYIDIFIFMLGCAEGGQGLAVLTLLLDPILRFSQDVVT
jgi:hypothetical protein